MSVFSSAYTDKINYDNTPGAKCRIQPDTKNAPDLHNFMCGLRVFWLSGADF